jgi:hypothetical protein
MVVVPLPDAAEAMEAAPVKPMMLMPATSAALRGVRVMMSAFYDVVNVDGRRHSPL